ncbi:PAS domain S-box protein [Pelagibius litoralis]|uniref:histidine kinase n=1 Tax=Pelagibius litoralis TaxID=374515 RepID=A0A967EWM8_9PROT|nr:PAS domain-containing sensor histidine kinase [Pelagibius litoralis]NIA67473.1 PAS domain S-box protein [Pelagibius litoralis]
MKVREEYQIALEISPTPLMMVSRDGRIVLSNKRLNALFGYGEGELRNQLVDVLVPSEIKDFHPELREAFFEVPTNRSMGTGRDLFGARKDGEMIPVEIGLDPVEQDGEALVMVSVLDIRARKQGEAKIRQAIDAASSAMVMIDENGKIELVNELTQILFGYAPGELIGESIEKLVPERYRRKHTVYRMSYQNSRDRRSMGVGRNLFGLSKHGSEFPVEIGLNPIDGQEGGLVMATIIDISQRKQHEERIQQTNEELLRLNTELSEFAYSASHDLKAPLSSISGILQFCESDLEAGNFDEVRENLGRVRQLASRLAGRIEDMLALARTDNVDDGWQDLDLADSVAEIWQVLRTKMSSAIELTTAFGHTDPIRTVPARFSIVLENILSNAIKYRDQSKPNSTVHIETWDDDGVLKISVRDNGIGIPAEHHADIFKLFKRVANTDEPGSGLGLALVQKNVLRLKGEIIVQSTGDGTTFTIALPQVREETRVGGVESRVEIA